MLPLLPVTSNKNHHRDMYQQRNLCCRKGENSSGIPRCVEPWKVLLRNSRQIQKHEKSDRVMHRHAPNLSQQLPPPSTVMLLKYR